MSKNVFTSNWYMYRVCLPAVLKDSEAQPSIVQSKSANRKVPHKNCKGCRKG
ncbi:MAG: hypothetical protein ACUVUE_07845 [Candidatus Bathycorpusculaceae bacterium]